MELQGRQALKVSPQGDWIPAAVSGGQGGLVPAVLVVPARSVAPRELAGSRRSGVGTPSRCNW